MIIRECNNHDAEKFLQMLQQLDKETKFMLFEPGNVKQRWNKCKNPLNRS